MKLIFVSILVSFLVSPILVLIFVTIHVIRSAACQINGLDDEDRD